MLFEIIEQYPEKLDIVFLRMRRTQRDFDIDRQLLREEAQRQGLKLSEEEAWVWASSDSAAAKKAA